MQRGGSSGCNPAWRRAEFGGAIGVVTTPSSGVRRHRAIELTGSTREKVVMNKKQVLGRVKAVKARIREVTGRLIGDVAMQRTGTAEKKVADKKVLYEDLKADFKRLA